MLEGDYFVNNTCFVIMPIGTQKFGDFEITEKQLREKYDYIIKNAILKADPTLEVFRADDEINPSSISNDIFTKLMHSKYVIADITYPNANVFYELGIRHAIRTGTILIKENINIKIPFDISHLRHIEYSQEISGMDKLSENLKKIFEYYSQNPQKPDNQFLELSQFTGYEPVSYKKQLSKGDAMKNTLLALQKHPGLIPIFASDHTQEEKNKLLNAELIQNPQGMAELFGTLADLGAFE